jgi:hypothetical protein
LTCSEAWLEEADSFAGPVCCTNAAKVVCVTSTNNNKRIESFLIVKSLILAVNIEVHHHPESIFIFLMVAIPFSQEGLVYIVFGTVKREVSSKKIQHKSNHRQSLLSKRIAGANVEKHRHRQRIITLQIKAYQTTYKAISEIMDCIRTSSPFFTA